MRGGGPDEGRWAERGARPGETGGGRGGAARSGRLGQRQVPTSMAQSPSSFKICLVAPLTSAHHHNASPGWPAASHVHIIRTAAPSASKPSQRPSPNRLHQHPPTSHSPTPAPGQRLSPGTPPAPSSPPFFPPPRPRLTRLMVRSTSKLSRFAHSWKLQSSM